MTKQEFETQIESALAATRKVMIWHSLPVNVVLLGGVVWMFYLVDSDPAQLPWLLAIWIPLSTEESDSVLKDA